MINAVYFGYAGVLSPTVGGHDLRQLSNAHFGMFPESQFIDYLNEQHDRGAVTTEDYFAELSMRMSPYGEPYTVKQYEEESPIFQRNERIYCLAEKLRANGIATGILASMPSIDRQLLAANGAFEGFNPVVIATRSKDIEYPDELAVHQAEMHIGQRADEVLYVRPRIIKAFRQFKYEASVPTGNMQHFVARNSRQIVSRTISLIQRQNGVNISLSDHEKEAAL